MEKHNRIAYLWNWKKTAEDEETLQENQKQPECYNFYLPMTFLIVKNLAMLRHVISCLKIKIHKTKKRASLNLLKRDLNAVRASVKLYLKFRHKLSQVHYFSFPELPVLFLVVWIRR